MIMICLFILTSTKVSSDPISTIHLTSLHSNSSDCLAGPPNHLLHVYVSLWQEVNIMLRQLSAPEEDTNPPTPTIGRSEQPHSPSAISLKRGTVWCVCLGRLKKAYMGSLDHPSRKPPEKLQNVDQRQKGQSIQCPKDTNRTVKTMVAKKTNKLLGKNGGPLHLMISKLSNPLSCPHRWRRLTRHCLRSIDERAIWPLSYHTSCDSFILP